MADNNLFDKIRIGIASPGDIRQWTSGEVKKPETINYRTFKPERDGLFCQRIFGPMKDWECDCGRYKKVKFRGITCERCGVEVTRSKVRRERMGHIELAAPVCHIWYLKGVPSPIALLLDISARLLEKVIYFASFIIIDLDSERIAEMMPAILDAVEKEKLVIQESMTRLEIESLERLSTEMINNPDEYEETFVRDRLKANFDRIRAEYRDADERLRDMDVAAELLGKLEKNQLIDEDKWRAISKLLDAVGRRMREDLSELVRANIGADAVKELLRRIDLEALARSLRLEVVNTITTRRARAIKRLELVEALLVSKSRPEWMILDVAPVISPELRPMVQLDGGRFATSDLNDLYRRIINRNNRLKKIIDIQAPESIINHEKRLLQEAMDALIDNGRRQRPVVGSNQRPLKSLSDMLKGKEGRFRKNLLGKRVDYSGRSVIVVGPHLKLHQCGLPKDMALELFKPFVMKALAESNKTVNVKMAKKLIERVHPEVWDGLERVIKEHPVLLNRAPTLHRLGIQAFEPVLVDGKAIQLHPLVCHAYNADFDGDQMAVHVPLSLEAQAEARVLMLSTQNLFSPADGRPVSAPIQDIVLGCYALTYTDREAQAAFDAQVKAHEADPENNPAPYLYSSPEEVEFHLSSPGTSNIGLNSPVRVRLQRPVFRPNDEIEYRDPRTGIEYVNVTRENEFGEEVTELDPLEQHFETIVVTTTPGRLIFNAELPYPMRYSDHSLSLELTSGALKDLVRQCHKKVGAEGTIELLDDLKDLGFRWATKAAISVALTDMDPPNDRDDILQRADDRANNLIRMYRRGQSNFGEMQGSLIELWTDTYDEVGKGIEKAMKQKNPLSIITTSGARGSVKQLAQLSGMRGLMFNQFNETIYELPVRNSFQKGLNMLEFFVTTHGARKGLADTALRTADAGYLTRRLVDVAQDMIIRTVDCGTADGVYVSRIEVEGKQVEKISDRAIGRVALATVQDPETGEVITQIDEIVTAEQAAKLHEIDERYVAIMSETASDEERDEIARQFEAFGFAIDSHHRMGFKVRSPITCEQEQGLCAKCYGLDLATQKLVEVGLAAGIIAAQSIGEPGTQLTMRTFHMGGVAGTKSVARTNQYKTTRFMRQFQEDFEAATSSDIDKFDPGKLLEVQNAVIQAQFTQQQLPEEDEKKKTPRKTKAAEKAAEKATNESKRMWERNRKTFFYAWTGESSGIVRVEEIFEARKQPRGKAIICALTGTILDIARTDYGRFVTVLGEVRLDSNPPKDAIVAETQDWETETVTTAAGSTKHYKPDLQRIIGQKLNSATIQVLRKHEIEKLNVLWPKLVPPTGTLPVEVGKRVIKGDPLTSGPLDPHEVLELAGSAAVHEYFVENLQAVYKDQGVDINDKHLEVIIRQMLRKRRIKEPGNTPFLPGQMVDRFRLSRENEKVRQRILSGQKIKITDPVTGDVTERDPKEATADWILLGITEASLATDSFLSAASFQKTTRVLTEAAVRGRQDPLAGLKENVIIGRLIPAGTGVKMYRELSYEADASQPAWSQRSMEQLSESDGHLQRTEAPPFGGMTMADLAAQEPPSVSQPVEQPADEDIEE